MNRRDFQQLAETRLADAKALFEAGRYDATFYLSGYAVECALKACIAKKTREHDFPAKDGAKFYKHDLQTLVDLAELEGFSQDLLEDPLLAANWNFVKIWNESSRYKLQPDLEAARSAEDLLNAIQDPAHGVLECLSKYW